MHIHFEEISGIISFIINMSLTGFRQTDFIVYLNSKTLGKGWMCLWLDQKSMSSLFYMDNLNRLIYSGLLDEKISKWWREKVTLNVETIVDLCVIKFTNPILQVDKNGNKGKTWMQKPKHIYSRNNRTKRPFLITAAETDTTKWNFLLEKIRLQLLEWNCWSRLLTRKNAHGWAFWAIRWM